MTKNIIIIPTYNEKDNIAKLLKEIFNLLPETQVLVVDDNSPDGTYRVIQELQSRYKNLSLIINEKRGGLGRAYIAGFEHILKDISIEAAVMMDGDLSHPAKYLPAMIRAMEENNFGLIIGSRYVVGGKITEKWGVHRRLLSRFAGFYCRLILKYPLRDWTGGFNVIKMDFLRKIDLQKLKFGGYAFIIALKFYLLKSGSKFKELPISFEERGSGQSKMSFLIILEGMIIPWRIIIREFFYETLHRPRR